MIVLCFGCPSAIILDETPVRIYLGRGKGTKDCTPNPDAVYICDSCRLDKDTFKKARTAMMKRIGYIQPGMGFE